MNHVYRNNKLPGADNVHHSVTFFGARLKKQFKRNFQLFYRNIFKFKNKTKSPNGQIPYKEFLCKNPWREKFTTRQFPYAYLHIHKNTYINKTYMAHTMEVNKYLMEETEDSMSIREVKGDLEMVVKDCEKKKPG